MPRCSFHSSKMQSECLYMLMVMCLLQDSWWRSKDEQLSPGQEVHTTFYELLHIILRKGAEISIAFLDRKHWHTTVNQAFRKRLAFKPILNGSPVMSIRYPKALAPFVHKLELQGIVWLISAPCIKILISDMIHLGKFGFF